MPSFSLGLWAAANDSPTKGSRVGAVSTSGSHTESNPSSSRSSTSWAKVEALASAPTPIPTPMRTFTGRPARVRDGGLHRVIPSSRAGPSKRSTVAKDPTGERFSRVGWCTGTPRASTPTTETESGIPSRPLTAASSRTTMVVMTPASPSARAANRMLQANG